MIVQVRPEAECVELGECEDFGSFAVVVPAGTTTAKVDTVLRAANWGEAAEQHAWVRANAVVEAATDSGVSAGWFENYRRMVDYARKKGWWRESDRALRAHIEYDRATQAVDPEQE